MNVQFCDLCNESIPLSDLDSGRAVRRNERLICAACEAAMSGHHARPEGKIEAGGLPFGPPPRTTPAAGTAVPAVALAFASVALVVAVGASAYFLWQLEESKRANEREFQRIARSVPEQARSASAELVELARASEVAVNDAQRELVDLGRRLDALERGALDSGGLERRMEKLEERQALVLDLSSRIDHQAASLAEFELALAELGSAPRERESEPVRAPAEGQGTEEHASAPEVDAAPTWEPLLADLISPTGSTRWQAVQSLGKTRDPRVVPHLVPLLKDSDIFVRMAVARLLGQLGSHVAIPALIDALEDEEVTVRESALVSLRTLSGQSFPFDPKARDGDRSKRVKAWRDWWEEASKTLLGEGKKSR
ncbi:MAG: HEAT repeat domain-containing protein, partial [Planctomycetota bacterium]